MHILQPQAYVPQSLNLLTLFRRILRRLDQVITEMSSLKGMFANIFPTVEGSLFQFGVIPLIESPRKDPVVSSPCAM